MLWAVAFFLIAVAAAILGFGMAAATFAAEAKLVFYIAVVLMAVSLIGQVMKRV
jgi:uncharacterized membrane protein YtjA (UPF0391 family)